MPPTSSTGSRRPDSRSPRPLDSFDVGASSIPPEVFDYLSSLEWVRAQANLAIIGPAGSGKSHTLIGLGIAAIRAGHKVRYFTAADLVETLYRDREPACCSSHLRRRCRQRSDRFNLSPGAGSALSAFVSASGSAGGKPQELALAWEQIWEQNSAKHVEICATGCKQ
jgi:hypothetical protein